MRKVSILLLFLLIISIISITGCQSKLEKIRYVRDKEKDKPGIVGYVMAKEQGKILVVDPMPQDFSSTGGVKEFYNAIWFSNVPDKIKLGDKVEVWFDAVAESYPGQSEAKNIQTVDEEKPEGADQTVSQALNKVLTENKIEQLTVPYSISYDREKKQWTIQLKEILWEEGEILEFQIEDK